MESRDTLFIGGEWVEPQGSETIEVVSPHTEEVIATVPHASEADIDTAVAAARQAFDAGEWSGMEVAERADLMAALSAAIGEKAGELAETITAENGSPITFSHMGQVFAAQMVLDWFTGYARDTFQVEEQRQGILATTLVRHEPVGVVGAIVPWNVPLFVTMLKLAPAMVAGCTMVLKPAPETPLDAYMLAELLEKIGLPKGVVNLVPAGREVGEHIVRHPGVDKIAFTGSTAAGKRIASICGEQLKRVTLELGGKSAAVILDDADLTQTLDGLMPASTMNNGEACVAQTRILASRERYAEVVDGLSERVGALKVGDPMDDATEVGPLVAERQRERVEKYLASGQEDGARITVGGGRPAGMDTGWYVEPTVFADVDNSMRIAQEEIFGPVLSVIPYDTVDDAVAIANDSTYGLSGSVWGQDAEQCLDVARRVRTGHMNVNGFMLEPCAPFGGFRQSGLGRELGPEGLAAYLEDKALNLFGDGESFGIGA